MANSIGGGLFGTIDNAMGFPTIDPNATTQTGLQYNQQAAQSGINMNSLANQQNGLFGSTTAAFSPSGQFEGYNTSVAPGLSTGLANTEAGFTGATGNMPTNVNFDMTTPTAIANANYAAGAAALQPQYAQQQNALDVNLAERGIPIQNTTDAQGNPTSIWGQAEQNLHNSQDLGFEQLAANAYNQIPGQQAQMTNTAIAQAETPGALAGQDTSLMQQIYGITPQSTAYNQGVTPVNYAQEVNTQADLAQKQAAANAQGLGSFLQSAAPIAMGAMMAM